MVPSGPPTPIGNGAPTVPPSTLLRTNSGLLGPQNGGVPSQSAFPSLVSPRSQYNSASLLGNMANVSSLLGSGGGSSAMAAVNQGFINGSQSGGTNSGISGSGNLQRGGVNMVADTDPLSGTGGNMGFAASPVSLSSSNVSISGSSNLNANGPIMGSGTLVPDQQQAQQLEVQNFQLNQNQTQGQDPSNSLQIQSQQMLGARALQQFHVPNSLGQSLRGLSGDQTGQQLQALRNLGPVKLEPQMGNDQAGQQQPLQALRSLGPVKLEPQQFQNLRSLAPIKLEQQHSDQTLYQQQQMLQMARPSSQQMQLQAAHLQQQRLLQQQQQQQLLQALPQQRSRLQQQQQQFHNQALPVGSSGKAAVYESGTCARRLMQYMYYQQHRQDNSIEFWRKFVNEYFAPHAKKRWCVSLYGSGRQTTGVFPQDVWHCEICGTKPGRGFETTVEVLPRLCKIKYDSGTLEELLYVDMPREYCSASGHIVLEYAKAIQESVFEKLRVVRDGQLRIVFSTDLKICSWEFCARSHEELIPRRLLIPQVGQLGTVAQKYQTASQNAPSNQAPQELQNYCNSFAATAKQLAKSLEVPLVNDLGYTKRYVRCLQISEVVNSMKDLIDYSQETRTGPMASLINFPRRTGNSTGLSTQGQQQQPEEQVGAQNANNDRSTVQATPAHLAASNGASSVNNSIATSSASAPTSTIASLLHQNSMNSRQNNPSSPFSNPSVSSPNMQQPQPNPSSPYPNQAPSSSNQGLPNSANSPANSAPLPTQSNNEADPNDPQNSMQQIIQEMMMSSQVNGGGNMNSGVGSSGNEMKSVNGITQMGNPALKGPNCLVGNGGLSNGVGFGNMGGVNPMPMNPMNGMRSAMANSSMGLNGRVNVSSIPQDSGIAHQQDMGNRLLNGLGTVNSFNNLPFDWKSSS
ncbi:transcriptional corepressor SEUSS [Amborella trichopoda]|uniref:LIM interaction domain-containing protein n=1 Tax=Amborella trichopoda TaxID=13333 RepID=U5DBG5_AMBTC|nr:transcriptional corepressor SEUSS [Amborella trichopoda]ERN19874.1 hypothetical protein AMTR_s00071p00041100 [Amborella trichopoda]|eukprot:XP_020531697.1 transcriptional corepressor SEUSS [Amborella trichopoda]